jgi:hypothetical protein
MVAAACVLPCRGVRSVTLECESDGYAKIFRWSRGGFFHLLRSRKRPILTHKAPNNRDWYLGVAPVARL